MPSRQEFSASGFDALLRDHPDRVAVFEVDGAFAQANSRFLDLLGDDTSDHRRVALSDIVHPDDLDAVLSEFALAAGGEHREYRMRTVAGAVETLADATNIALRDDAGTVVAVMIVVRQARGLEKALQKTLDQMGAAVAYLDRDWRFTYLNDTAMSAFPDTGQSLLGTSIWSLSPGVEESELGVSFRKAMDGGETITTRMPSEETGDWFSITLYPTDDGIALYSRDVNEEELTRLRLSESMGRLHTQAVLLDAARDAIFVRDLEGIITYWNHGAEELYGWMSHEAVGQNVRELTFADPSAYDNRMTEAMVAGHWEGELEQVARDGRTIIADCRWQLMFDGDDGRPTSVLCLVSDITESKRQAVKEYRAQRMESLGTLAGGIAHDLNNVLTPILMSSQLLASSETDDARLGLLASIESGAQRGADMIRQVLAFARGEEGERVSINVQAIVDQLLAFCRDTLPKSISLTTELAPNPWPLMGDRTQILQVLMNLVTNARDAMPDGGHLTIRARNMELGDTERAGHVVFEVEDSGTGMDSETALKVFEPFFTTKDLGTGTGLGLSTSMAIARGHGGHMEVYSEPGRGSRFQLRLPSSELGSAAPPTLTLTTIDLPQGRGERVLVVDDEATIRQIVRQTLEANGYEVLVAGNGLEAIEVIDKAESAIDLVFTDMMMPVMDGAATATYLLQHHPHIPVIAASGLNANGGVARAAHAGVQYFLSKPFTTIELLQATRNALDARGVEPA